MVGEPVRQCRRLEDITAQLAAMPDVLGAILVGSMAGGVADACSDIDLLICTEDGHFSRAWDRRHELHQPNALTCWDQGPAEGAEIGVHRWVTGDMVLVEALIAAPGAGVRLARPYRVVAGDPEVSGRFQPRPPIDRAEFSRAGAHPVDLAFEDLKNALRDASASGLTG